MDAALHHAAAVGLNGKLYVIGGYVQGWTPTDAVYEYDPASHRWRTLAPMPTSRGALGAAVLGGKIHVVSGVGAGGKNTSAHESTTRPRICGQRAGHSRRRAIT
jgi:N-acetylneuraminic acid mutarotase